MKFRATLHSVQTKPQKDLERVTVIQIVSETSRDLAGDLSLMVGSTIEVEINQPAWYKTNHGADGKAQASIDGYLNEICAVCGHARGDHSLDPATCLGDGGACTCDTFVNREEAEKDAAGETAQVVEEIAPEILCKICGHEYGHHRYGAEHTCLAYMEDTVPFRCPCPGFQAVEPEEEYPVEGDSEALAGDLGLCLDCGHARDAHKSGYGCMVNRETGEIDSVILHDTCQCIRVYLEDGAPDGFVGDHDSEEPKPKRSRKPKKGVAA